MSNPPLHQLHSDEIIAVSRVEEDESVWGGGLELEEEVHGCVGLQGGQAQIAALGLEGDWIGNNGANPEASIELTEINVTVFAQVNVEHAVKPDGRRRAVK